jgi:hypothetical protein
LFVRAQGFLVLPLSVALFAVILALGPSSQAEALNAFGPIINISNSPAATSDNPYLVVDASGVIHLVWSEASDIVYTRSSDGGASFTAPVAVSTTASAGKPRVSVSGSSVYVVWHDDSGPKRQILFARSTNGGVTFGPATDLSPSAATWSQRPRMAVGPTGTIFVVWDEGAVFGTPGSVSGQFVAMRRSFDGGATFEASVVNVANVVMTPQVGSGLSEGTGTVYPAVAVDPSNGNVYVTWHDGLTDATNSFLQVLFKKSTDANNPGAPTFSPSKNISQATFQAHCASMTLGPTGRILVAYEIGKQQTTLHASDAGFVQSTNGGTTFSAPIDLTQNSTPATLSDYAWTAEGPDGTIVVGWEDNTEGAGGDLDTVIRSSTDGGVTFGPLKNLSNTTGTSTEVVVAFAPNGTLYVVWEEHNTGTETSPADVWMRTATIFADVPADHFARPWIEALYGAGVTGGCSTAPLRYCPEDPVTREQMAVFLLRSREGAGFTPPPCTTAPFADVPCASAFAPWIQALVSRGITAGCGGGIYCPTSPVTREQMAVLLLKTREGAGFTPPPCTTAPFADVPCASAFAPWIQELVARAITAGCAPTAYCPASAVTRAEMAIFLVKMFNLPL